MRIIDTHLHLIDKASLSYPWLSGAPSLDRNFSLATYWADAEPLGIERALHMEVDVAEPDQDAETNLVLGLGPPVVGAIAGCRPEHPEFPAQLERLAAKPGVRGLRRILHESPDELGLRPLFLENLRRLPAHDLSFDLCVLARQLPVAAQILNACPDVRFVLDHCGVPDVKNRAADPEAFQAWQAGICTLSGFPNLACKISGIVAYAGPDWMAEDLRPFVEHCIACFGWGRVVWGSDWPVCTLTGDLTRWMEATHIVLAGCSLDECERLLSRNAERIYRL